MSHPGLHHTCRHCSPSGSHPLPVSVPSPDVVVAPAHIPCPSASALACRRPRRRLSSLARQRPLAFRRRCASSRPLPVSVCPRLPSLSSPPALIPALVPCPSASALACRRCRRCHHRRQWTRPANRHCLPPPSPSRRRRRPCHPVNIRCTVPPQSLSPPSRLRHRRRHQSFAFWAKYLFIYRGISYQ